MKRKEIKKYAEKIAAFEKIIELNQDEGMVEQAKEMIMKYTRQITDPVDLLAIDELVLQILNKKS